MSEQKGRKLIPSGGGIFNNLSQRIKLIFRLMGDNRISPFLKLLPIGSALYFVIPDLAIGPLDDVAVLWLGTYLFVELCPPEIVEEHLAALRNQALPGVWHDPDPDQEEVIEGEFWEKKS
ncbi:MAG: hypothetical protein A2W35_09820 [Chloroflexi bacterium RBG_16_57_11]|nr:MAG: hypothetical protein A2W35_09820 [Chloroflexi bacterium RBG_16_57_11]